MITVRYLQNGVPMILQDTFDYDGFELRDGFWHLSTGAKDAHGKPAAALSINAAHVFQIWSGGADARRDVK